MTNFNQEPRYYPPIESKKRVWPWLLGGLLVLFGLVIASCAAITTVAVNEVDKGIQSLTTGDVVVLEATGSGTVSYSDNGNNVLADPFSDGWTKEVTMSEWDAFIVTNDFMNPGPVSCKISKNGVVVSESSAAEGMVTCTLLNK